MESFRYIVTVKADTQQEANEILHDTLEGVSHPVDPTTITYTSLQE